jgi:hypothetical protein
VLDEASLKVSVNVLTKGNAGAELGFVEVEADFDRSKKVISGTVERALRREFGVFAFLAPRLL